METEGSYEQKNVGALGATPSTDRKIHSAWTMMARLSCSNAEGKSYQR
jgi:hypothetical protein